jgi:hypothetical protein
VRTATLDRGLFVFRGLESDLSRGYVAKLIGLGPEEARNARITVIRTKDEPEVSAIPARIEPSTFSSPLRLSDAQIATTTFTPIDSARPQAGLVAYWPIVAGRHEIYEFKAEIPDVSLPPLAPREVKPARAETEILARQERVARAFAPIFIQRSNSRPDEEARLSGEAFEDYFTRWDFDGNWYGYDNWENLAAADTRGFDLRAVYYSAGDGFHYFCTTLLPSSGPQDRPP